MKHLLLPTDFSIPSLWPVHDMVKQAKHQKITIHLFHLLDMPTSISDLFSMKFNKPYHAIPANFTEAYQLLCNKYSASIENIMFQFLYGSTTFYLNSFIKAKNIEAVYMLADYTYKHLLPQSISFESVLAKCNVPVHHLPLNSEALSEYQILSALLHGKESGEAMATKKATKSMISFT